MLSRDPCSFLETAVFLSKNPRKAPWSLMQNRLRRRLVKNAQMQGARNREE
jgi:hypothetical protein